MRAYPMQRSPAMRGALLLALGACTVHSTKSVDSTTLPTAVGKDNADEVRLISPHGKTTGWLPSARLTVVGDAICLRSGEPAWKRIDAIRISRLTDANIAAILVDLPHAIRVIHLGGGEVELATNGVDLTPWLRSVAHDPRDRHVMRYRVRTWQAWTGPFTWSELPDQGAPMVGWPIAGTTAEVRSVDVGSSIAFSLLAIPVVLAAAGIAVIARAPAALPRGEPKPYEPPAIADVPLATVGAAIDRSQPSPIAGNWSPRLCK